MVLNWTWRLCKYLRPICRFAINLQQNPEPCDGEVAFHFNPRPGEQQCVRNSFDGGSWMDEERDQPHFPFDEGRSFTLRIEVAEEGFRTYVNGKPYVNFSHRLDLGNVHYLYLTEGAEFYDISYQDRYVRSKTFNKNVQGGWTVFGNDLFIKKLKAINIPSIFLSDYEKK